MPKKPTVPWMVTDPPFPINLTAEELDAFRAAFPMIQMVCTALENDKHCSRGACRRSQDCVAPHRIAEAGANFFNLLPPCVSGLTGLGRLIKAMLHIKEELLAEEEEYGYEVAHLRACYRYWKENTGEN